ncbi:DUF2281 domain-containing protein [Chitinimonas arctica]|uniref:DUF2281 domain-containing protein n=1 Tax=Chitinimonas arctica TaxID=2594795 RepID=A0A516SFS3_9NEIS|nr:DUF2281 domain-containing protein [Chitinimonas arctica]QDQ26992.1 DUF2281 domain-containing protein [Chitinimonas arctica]
MTAKAGKPTAKPVSVQAGKPVRKPGALKGKIRIAEDFDTPLSDNLLAIFEGWPKSFNS